MTKKTDLIERQKAPLKNPSDISPDSVKDISGALNALLATYLSFTSRRRTFIGT